MGKKLKIAKRSMSYSDMVNEITEGMNEDREEDNQIKRKDVKNILDNYINVLVGEIEDNGIVAIPGVVRIIRKYKPAKPKRKGINPFTGEKAVFKAKPESYAAKARPLTKARKAAAGQL